MAAVDELKVGRTRDFIEKSTAWKIIQRTVNLEHNSVYPFDLSLKCKCVEHKMEINFWIPSIGKSSEPPSRKLQGWRNKLKGGSWWRLKGCETCSEKVQRLLHAVQTNENLQATSNFRQRMLVFAICSNTY